MNQTNQMNQIDQTNHRGREAIIRRFMRSRNQSGEWRNGTSFGLNDLEALVRVAHEAKEWIAASSIELSVAVEARSSRF